MNVKYITIVFVIVCSSLFGSAAKPHIEIVKIWDSAPHSAFTDLLKFKGSYYCSFREGTGHIPGTDDVVRILKSANGEDWQSIALLEKKGIDLRDPKLSVTPDGRIMVIIGGSIYHESKLIYAEKAQQFANNLTRVQNQETGQYYTWWDSNPKHQIIGWFNCATEDIKAILEYDKMNKNN